MPRSYLNHFIFQIIDKIFSIKRKRFKYAKISILLNQKPFKGNQITLSKVKNNLGINIPKLNWDISKDEIKDLRNHLKDSIEFLYSHNIVEKKFINLDIKKDFLNEASHHMGTTRMGTSINDSVVDSNLKVFNSNNLFIIGSSVFRTGGNCNPTLTIVALSIRLAEYINKNEF